MAISKILFLSFFVSVMSESHAVGINFNKIQKFINESCEVDDIDFKKKLWESDLAETGNYSSELTEFNNCLSSSDKVYAEIYYQYKNNEILIKESIQKILLTLINNKEVEEDLLNLITWLYPKIKNFKEAPLRDAWRDTYQEQMLSIQQLMTPAFASKEEVRETFNYEGRLPQGYDNKLRLFLLCRRNRNYHCLMVGKDKDNRPIRVDESIVWSHPALAMSSRGLPSNVVNGQTPQGVHTIDSVMPEANRQISFGKFRRVILNWVEGTFEDRYEENFLPQITHKSNWWRRASLSKKVGRKDLRIHGTGRINNDPLSTHFPFRKSAGCITQREGIYGDIDYIDQRLLLDKLIESLGLEVNYANEEQIKGVLYVIELDDKQEHVTMQEFKKIINE
ncbi:MAG: hypothetical protein CME61_02060 [Halobacteriovoraceae bacterium]|nr:hypothetical protein [Halobacteriovoraceae bacterium]